MPDDIRRYLESIGSSSRELNSVVPPPEASKAIEAEIERRVPGLTAKSLAETEVKTIERNLTANPRGFVDQTLLAIEDVTGVLTADRATAFELRLANLVANPNWDFGQVKLRVRYVTT